MMMMNDNTHWSKSYVYGRFHQRYIDIIVENNEFYAPRSKIGGHIVFVLSVILSFCHSLWNFNLSYKFWTVSARALIFHMSIPCDKTFPWVSIIFDPVTLTLEFDPFKKNFNLTYNFWTVSARALIFHMSIPCDKTFLLVPLFFILWPWPWSLNHFLKTLTILITFEQWVLELWHFTWVSLMIRPLVALFFTLTWEFDLLFKNFNVQKTFE